MRALKKLSLLFAAVWYWMLRAVARQNVEPEPPSVPVPKKPVPPAKLEDPLWHFKSSILDRLDEYFVCIKRLQRYDPDSYDLFSRTGFSVSSNVFFNGGHTANRARLKDDANRWSFGGFFFPKTEAVYEFLPSFVYFRKLTRPSCAERFKGDVYSLTVLYDNRNIDQHWRSSFSFPVTCHIGVDAEGNTRLLRERVQSSSWIQPHRKHGRKGDSFRLKMYSWQYPSWLFYAGIEHGESPEVFATNLLVMALVTHVRTLEKIIVRAKRDGLVAAFGIELARAKYFFADRDTSALAADGKRKRIFHSVTAHPRTLSTGRVTSVRFHYRGLRRFDWQGYGISIVFPKNSSLVAFPGPARNEEDIKTPENPKWLASKEVGKIMSEALEA